MLALSVVLAVPAGLTPVAQAAEGPGRPGVPKQRSSKVEAMNAAGAAKARKRVAASAKSNAADTAKAAKEQRTAHWPEPGTADVPLAPRGKAKQTAVGGLAVSVGSLPGATAPERTRIAVLDRKATRAAGIRGVVLTAQADRSGKAELTVDYASFASAVGGGWSGRLRLVEYPRCVLTTPKDPKCRTAKPLEARNDITAQTLSAPLDLTAPPRSTAPAGRAASASRATASTATVLAVTPDPSGQSASGAGDFSATPLASSSTWEAGGSSGSFTWAYPMSAPAPAAGPAPSLNLAYDSGSIDGRNASTNNQGTDAGEGFGLSTVSYVERRYGSCERDGHDKQYDLCWKFENASLVLNGRSTELVKDDTDGTWRLRDDDASTVTRGTGATNGDDNGEHWIVTTGEGTKYHFGVDKLADADTERTNSVWTVPVFGDDAGEPGHDKGDAFADRALTQAWRWNLDYVEDTHGNVMTYWYTAEKNHYRKNKASTANTPYTRGGYLNEIRYGQRKDTLFTTTAPYKVGFSYAERCTAADCSTLNEDTAKYWPDVPYDAICAAGTGKDDCLPESPSFFTRKRLTEIETSVLSGTAHTPVDSWVFTQEFLNNGDIGDSTDQTLTLESIRRTGHTGTDITLDPVTFTYHKRPNRVAGGTQPGGGNILPLTRPRVNTVTSEVGAITTVTYSEPECVRGSRMPVAEDDNNEACYPLYWHINGAQDASLDWFHKYRVTAVNAADPAGHGELVEHHYSYEKPAWHYNDSPFLTADERTWSSWRGYQKVTVRTGAGTGTQSRTVSTFFQGMHGDKRKAGGTRSVALPGADVAGLDVPDFTDADQFAGFVRQTITYDGGTPVSVNVNDPWSARTATQHKSYADIESYYVRTGKATTHTYLTVPKSWRTTSTTTSYDSYGMAVKVDSAGNTAKTGDETCTRTWYARNDKAGINSLTTRVRITGRPCATKESDLTLPASSATAGDVLGDTATVYDNPAATGWSPDQQPTDGLESWTGRATAYPVAETGAERAPTSWQRTSKKTFDALGRPLSVIDTGGRETTTLHTPTGAGVPTKTVVTNAKGHKTTTFLDGMRGVPVRTYDANSKKTEQTYDALGRLTDVWRPDRSKDGGQSASVSFRYTLERGKAPAIATSKIKSSDTVTKSYEIFDSLLRPLQKQTPTPLGGRLLTDTRYDSRGLAHETYAEIFDSTTTPNGTYARAEYGESPKQTNIAHDGAGRAVSSTFLVFGEKRWTTTTTYTGDSTATSAVDGGKATRVITDALGRTEQRREYAGPDPRDAEYGGALGVSYTTTRHTYTRDGKEATITGPDGGTWSSTYDLFGRRVSSTDPDKGASTTGYTAADQIDWTKDSAGHHLLYGYDELGRTTGLWSGSRTDAGKLAAWTFDTVAKGQPTGSTRYDGGATTAGKAYTKSVVTYDNLYRATATQLSLDAKEPLVVAGAAQATYSFGTAYNLDGTVQHTTEPAAAGLPAETIERRYTPTGQPTSVFSGTSGYLQAASYSATGQVQQLTLAVSAATEAKKTYLNNEYEQGTDRLSRSYVTMPQTAPYKPQDLSYTYDQAGNVTKIKDVPNPDATLKAETQCFGYDGHRRLTEAWAPSTDDCTDKTIGGPAPYRTAYTYDTAGLRTSETRYSTDGTSTRTNYCYADSAQRHTLTTTTTKPCEGADPTYDYDPAGNTEKRPGSTASQSLDWNAEGKLALLTEGTKKTGYLYDTEGNLFIRRAIGDGESVLYLGATEIHRKVSGTTTKTWATRSYTAGETGIAVRSTESGNQKLSFLAGDHHGTSSLSVDATTQAVVRRYSTPFGAARGTTSSGTWPDDKRFLGKPADTGTGLTHIGAREYDPAIGRFLSVDPLLESEKHQSLNGYAYAENSPVTIADPTGLAGQITCSGSSCTPEMIAAEETLSPPLFAGGSGNNAKSSSSGNSGTASSTSTGNTCNAKCQAAILWEQQRLLALRQAKADYIRMMMYGVGSVQRKQLRPLVDLSGCDVDCRAEFLLLQIQNMPATNGSSKQGYSLFDPINNWMIDKGQSLRQGYDWLKNPKNQSEILGEMYEDAAELTGGACEDKGVDLTVCTTDWTIYGRGGTTIGDTYVTAKNRPDWVDPPRLKHERVHVKQWEKRGVKFGWDYAMEGFDACENKYEEQAGFADGDYPCP
ncbi:RHS repeat-associated core domain-containing protein [Streptomyces sp. NPDC002889]|uniref:RHS repeat-associated core domain-containing protein n=1 Tax=Streptomyces sp. NPDC002889 TaxID=3364669 RepID=UPI0036CE503F